MIRIAATFDVSKTLVALQGRREQMPFAIALALTKTAGLVKDAERKEMIDVFDKPTPWTLNSVGTKPATKEDLSSIIFLKDRSGVSTGTPSDEYLSPQIKGGDRALKPFEYAFRSVGVLPSSHFMVPGQGAKLDQYGNMARGQIVQILSYFQAFGEKGYSANVTPEGKRKLAQGSKRQNTAGFAYFAVQPGSHLFPGIYQRFMFGSAGARQGAIKPIIMFVDSAHYEAIYDFAGVGELVVANQFPSELAKATSYALATAR